MKRSTFIDLFCFRTLSPFRQKRKCCGKSTTSDLNFRGEECSPRTSFAWLDFQSQNITIKTNQKNEKNLKGLTRKDLDMESLGVPTSAFDLPQYVSTGNSITLQLTFKCFLFDRKFHITLRDQGQCSTVRNGSEQNPELIYIMSHHLFVEDRTHTCTRSGRDKHLSVGLFGHA